MLQTLKSCRLTLCMLSDVYNGLHIEFIGKKYAAPAATVHGEAITKPIWRRENKNYFLMELIISQ